MRIALWQMTRETLSGLIQPYLDGPIPPEQIRLPGKRYAAGFYDPEGRLPDDCAGGELLGVPLVQAVVHQGNWACFTLTDVFYARCVAYVQERLPLPEEDGNCFILNRMLALSRKGGTGCGCPPEGKVQRALWLLLGGEESPAIRRAGEEAFLSMTLHLPPRNRQALLNECGDMADACARMIWNLFGGTDG